MSQIKDVQDTTIVKFSDGTYLGLFGKVNNPLQAIKFDGDWEREMQLKNNQLILSEESYKVKRIRLTTEIEFLDNE